MKTIKFGKINVEHLSGGEAVLTVSSPGQGSISVELTADELLLFMVEVGNALGYSRVIERRIRIEKDIANELRKRDTSCSIDGRNSTDAGEEI